MKLQKLLQFKYWDQVLLALAALLFVAQFSATTFELARYSTSRGILQAFDDDAAMAIEIGEKTRLYNDNGWSAYGPLYYRIAHVLSSLSPLSNPVVTTHFFLLLTSLLSAYALCWLLTQLWPMALPQRILSTCLLLALFLRNDTWAKMMIRAHPDWLLSFAAAFAFLFLYKLMETPDQKRDFHLAALGLALGFLTKKVFLFFIPSALLMFLSVKELRPQWKRFLKISLIYYFVIGFVQAFRVDRDIRFLLYQSKYSVAPDLASVIEWFRLTGAQIVFPLIGLVLIRILFVQKPILPKRNILIITVIAALIPFLLLLSRKVISAYDYYPMPFVAVMLVAASLLLCFGPPSLSMRKNWSIPVFLVVLLSGALTGFFTPKNLDKRYTEEHVCRLEAEKIINLITEKMDQGGKVYADPYVPFPFDKKYRAVSNGGWTRSWSRINEFGNTLIALNSHYYDRYTNIETPGLYTQKNDTNWVESRDFYMTLLNKETATDPFNRTWKKTVNSDCGWQIWELSK